MKTAISKILYQELGEGDTARAHEVLYTETMTSVGFSNEEITSALPSQATTALIEGYRDSASNPLKALGFVYGTEVVDLAMVSWLGQAVTQVTSEKRLAWVDIHISQEPDHVQQVKGTVEPTYSDEDAAEIITAAQEMWALWSDFFTTLEDVILAEESQHKPALLASLS